MSLGIGAIILLIYSIDDFRVHGLETLWVRSENGFYSHPRPGSTSRYRCDTARKVGTKASSLKSGLLFKIQKVSSWRILG